MLAAANLSAPTLRLDLQPQNCFLESAISAVQALEPESGADLRREYLQFIFV